MAGGGGVTVAIPVLNGGPELAGVLTALRSQTVAHELLVCDSGSSDGSAELARAHGARVIEIGRDEFGHGRTRNLLMAEAGGTHVALLTQDAEPAGERWLELLLGGFALAPDVGLVCGPYRARPGASPAVRIELDTWFRSLSPDRTDRIDRLARDEVSHSTAHVAGLVGARGFFTDANAAVARDAWEQVPFREIGYAEDRALALDMMRAGYAKVYVPSAAVIHSHDYTTAQELRRAFDEWRGLHDVYGYREPLSPKHAVSRLRGQLGLARRDPAVAGLSSAERLATLGAVALRNLARLGGALVGSRADKLPRELARSLSLEGRGAATTADRRPDPNVSR